MNRLSKTKLICYLAAIFVAGGVTGATVAMKATKQMAQAPPPGRIEARYLKERFQSKLNLTAEQAKVLEPILEKVSDDLKAIRSDSTKRIGGIMKNAYEQISKELTADQRVKLEQMKKDRPENNHRRFKPEPSHKSNSPPQNL